MTKQEKLDTLSTIFLGKHYDKLNTIDEQIRCLTMSCIFFAAAFPFIALGVSVLKITYAKAIFNFGIALLCIASFVLMRSKIPLNIIPVIPVTAFGAYCIYLLLEGGLNLWSALWVIAFPLIAIYLCRLTIGIVESLAVLAVMIIFLYSPIAHDSLAGDIKIRFIGVYTLITGLTVFYELMSIRKDKRERELKAELAHKNNITQTMQDSIPQGIFIMDRELKILPMYSKPLVSILSYYDSELAGRNFLDILNSSLDAKQLQIMKTYFEMVFAKAKSTKVLESVNPISEFVYKVDNRKKVLATNFYLLEDENTETVIIGIIQDISREKGFEKELHDQKEAQELEIKNMFDIIQIDPLVFQDFIEDAESNFNYINSILKDRSLTEKQVVDKFYQNIHAIKANAFILGMEIFARKLHAFEDDIKMLMIGEIKNDDILALAIKLESLMEERDNYITIVRKIEAFKNSNQVDTILVHTMNMAVEKTAAEVQKKVELKTNYLDMNILQSKLRRPIKDILFQCIRNSIYHGIETVEERIKKGKSPQGILTVSIKNSDGQAEATFSDDGQGLDWKKIKETYIEQHPGSKNPSKKTLLSSVFSPEFTTAAAPSIIAGRGVGLSIVRDLIKQNHGTINLDSSESGLIIRFTLPMPKAN